VVIDVLRAVDWQAGLHLVLVEYAEVLLAAVEPQAGDRLAVVAPSPGRRDGDPLTGHGYAADAVPVDPARCAYDDRRAATDHLARIDAHGQCQG